MNKGVIILIFVFVIISIISSIYIYSTGNEEVADEQILEIIKLEINNYCSQLDEQANLSTCPTCRINSYKKVEQISNPLDVFEYTLTKENEKIVVNFRIPLIYGWNTRNGEAFGTFEIEGNGIITNKDLMLAECKT